MNYVFEHTFAATRAELEGAILDDPSFFAMLAASCEALEAVRLLRQQDDGRTVVREVAYTPRPRIPKFAQHWIRPEMVSWVEASRYDRHTARFTYEIRPNIPEEWRDRFSSTGAYALIEQAGPRGTCTQRRIEGEIAVRAPLVGGVAERFLVGEVRRTFDQEAQALAQFVESRRKGATT